MKRFDGDVAMLPALSFWRAVVLTEDDCLVMSFEDLRGAFYLLSVPAGWSKWFAFNIRFTLDELALPSEGRDPHEPLYLAATVIPMGWLNAVGIVQGLHRELLLRGSAAGGTDDGDASASVEPGVALHHEVRRDKPMPPVGIHRDWNYLWQAYIDDYDQAEVLPRQAVDSGAALPVSQRQQQVRACYAHWHAPRSERKSGERCSEAVRLGVSINGTTGRLGAAGAKLARLFQLTLPAVMGHRMTKTKLQILLGLFMHAFLSRRESMSVFQRMWQVLQRWSFRSQALPMQCRAELTVALCHMPLLQVSLRAPIDSSVTASDASESGGGLCETCGLTTAGSAHLEDLETKPIAFLRDQLLLVTLFDTLCLLRECFSAMGVETAATGAFVSTAEERSLLRMRWADATLLQSTADLLEWSTRVTHRHPRVRHLLLGNASRTHPEHR
eukprot:4194179-Amphidinium_carterae.3